MKLAVILSTTNPETNWNALRLANLSLRQGDEVQIFLVGEGVEYEKSSSAKFNIREQLEAFMTSDRGKIFACGTCLTLREQNATETCPLSTLKNLYEIVRDCDKGLTF